MSNYTPQHALSKYKRMLEKEAEAEISDAELNKLINSTSSTKFDPPKPLTPDQQNFFVDALKKSNYPKGK